jgi:hypothetical protein
MPFLYVLPWWVLYSVVQYSYLGLPMSERKPIVRLAESPQLTDMLVAFCYRSFDLQLKPPLDVRKFPAKKMALVLANQSRCTTQGSTLRQADICYICRRVNRSPLMLMVIVDLGTLACPDSRACTSCRSNTKFALMFRLSDGKEDVVRLFEGLLLLKLIERAQCFLIYQIVYDTDTNIFKVYQKVHKVLPVGWEINPVMGRSKRKISII